MRLTVAVQHRSTAYILAEMLRMVNDNIPFTRPIWVSGNLDFEEQVCCMHFLTENFDTEIDIAKLAFKLCDWDLQRVGSDQITRRSWHSECINGYTVRFSHLLLSTWLTAY